MSPHPSRPDDGYDWDRFFGDQQGVPWIFHGTSVLHEEGIRSTGLAFSSRPYDNSEIEQVVGILGGHRLYGPQGSLGVLAAFTASTAIEQSVSLTFDWVRACRYAVLNRGGETLEYLLRNVDWALEPDQIAVLSPTERALLVGIQARLGAIAARHVPLVVAAELPRDWFGRLPFFADRNAFRVDAEGPMSERDQFLGVHYDPAASSARTGLTHGGTEFRVPQVSPGQLRAFVRVPVDESLMAYFGRTS